MDIEKNYAIRKPLKLRGYFKLDDDQLLDLNTALKSSSIFAVEEFNWIQLTKDNHVNVSFCEIVCAEPLKEWPQNGDECLIYGDDKCRFFFVGMDGNDAVFRTKDHDGRYSRYYSSPMNLVSKPLTLEKKEAKEREDAVKDMYEAANGDYDLETGDIFRDGKFIDEKLAEALYELYDSGYRVKE